MLPRLQTYFSSAKPANLCECVLTSLVELIRLSFLFESAGKEFRFVRLPGCAPSKTVWNHSRGSLDTSGSGLWSLLVLTTCVLLRVQEIGVGQRKFVQERQNKESLVPPGVVFAGRSLSLEKGCFKGEGFIKEPFVSQGKEAHKRALCSPKRVT